jgi:hypothetical protein
MLTDFGKGEIKGWKGEGFYVARLPGESEEDLPVADLQRLQPICP